jgi:hypothetical protein
VCHQTKAPPNKKKAAAVKRATKKGAAATQQESSSSRTSREKEATAVERNKLNGEVVVKFTILYLNGQLFCLYHSFLYVSI